MSACWPLQLEVHKGGHKHPMWGPRGNAPGSLGYFTNPRFSNGLSIIIWWPNLFFFLVYFCLRKTCMMNSSPPNQSLNVNSKWHVMWTYHNFFSKPQAHAFFCGPKHCWSQINEVLILSHNALSLNGMKFVGHQTSK